jgi:zinc transport system substrate-binding protein
MKKFLAFVLVLTFWNPLYAEGKPSVVVTTYPLFEVMQRVGGDTIVLEKLLPYGSDVHMFRLTPKMVAKTGKAALFVYNGAGLELWGEQLLINLSNKTKAVDMSRYVTLHDFAADAGCKDHDHHGHDHGEAVTDPHYWLDIANMMSMTKQATLLLSDLRPDLKEFYRGNAVKYIDELEQLRQEYRKALKMCEQKYLVSNHDAFGYLARSNGFETVAVTGLSPEQRPSARVMAEVMDLVSDKGIDTVFFEAFVSNNVARALARETGTSVESLQPLANLSADEAASNENYITIMRKNLAKIANALECH